MMGLINRVVRCLNKEESIVTWNFSDGTQACSLQFNEDIDQKQKPIDNGKKVATKQQPSPSPDGDHPFAVGDKVMYDGKKFTVTRAYFYKGKPLCILDKIKQVSITNLTPSK